MVQMKALTRYLRFPCFGLYIPHGSDESFKTFYEYTRVKTAFISHMVQMKVKFS